MAFDGITVHALTDELNDKLNNGRIDKIAQPEKDEIIITVKSDKGTFRLMISANASLPLAYLISSNKPSLPNAPNFCMLLRKHINNGRILSITQPGLDRIIDLEIEHFNEMGDLCRKHIIAELMGRHSNIIFTDENNTIIDSIKRINAGISSVREVLPGFPYFIPNTTGRTEALHLNPDSIYEKLRAAVLPAGKAIYSSFTGISPEAAEDICHTSRIDSDIPVPSLTDNELIHLSNTLYNYIDEIRCCHFNPAIIVEENGATHFSVVTRAVSSSSKTIPYESVSNMLEDFYADKNSSDRIRQRSMDLRQVINSALQRNYKKYDLQDKQLKDTGKKDKYRLYGELLNTYGYGYNDKLSDIKVLNYYNGEEITIPLDRDLSIRENSQAYFRKYNKLKRTHEALSGHILETKKEIEHLESISTALDIARDYDDLSQIREELIEFGFIRKNHSVKERRNKSASRPIHYISSDGYDIYVGKNNIQNEELTFKFANGSDWWFHAKNIPGSHVIVVSSGSPVPDSTFEEAAALAAFYSKGRNSDKVEIDYTEKKNVKKAPGQAPGFVIYHTNYSMNIAPDISSIKEA